MDVEEIHGATLNPAKYGVNKLDDILFKDYFEGNGVTEKLKGLAALGEVHKIFMGLLSLFYVSPRSFDLRTRSRCSCLPAD